MYRGESTGSVGAGGGGGFTYPSSITLSAQGDVTAAGADFTTAGFTMAGNITLANSADAIESGAYKLQLRSHDTSTGASSGAVQLDTSTNLAGGSGAYAFRVRSGGTSAFGIWVVANVTQFDFWSPSSGNYGASLVAEQSTSLMRLYNADFVPYTNNNHQCGTSAARWSFMQCYGVDVNSPTGANSINGSAAVTVGMSSVAANTAGLSWTHAGGVGGVASGAVGGAGGLISLIAGVGGAGALSFSSGAGGALTLKGGDAGATGGAGQGNGGNVTLDAGGGATGGTISIGATNASAITVGRSGMTTTINGTLRYDQTGTATSLNGYLIVNVGGASMRVPYYNP